MLLKAKPTPSGRLVALLLVLSSLAAPSSGTALESRSGKDIVVDANEVVADDLIATGATVTVDGTIQGDLIATGTVVTVNGTIEGDLLAAAQAVVVNGRVGDDARIVGMALEIRGEVGDDLLAAGLSLSTTRTSRIGGTADFSGYQALLLGEVAQDLSVKVNGLELRGRVGGSLDAEVGPKAETSFMTRIPSPVTLPNVAGGLLVGATALVDGDLSSLGPQPALLEPGAVVNGENSYESSVPGEQDGSWTTHLKRGASRWLALVAVGSLLLWLAPSWCSRASGALATNLRSSLVAGVLGVLASGALLLLVLALALLASVILGLVGLDSLGTAAVVVGAVCDVVLVGGLYLSLLYFAQVTTGLAGGSWIAGRFQDHPSRFLSLLLGALVYVVLRQIPVLGLLVAALVVVAGFGALVRITLSSVRSRSIDAGAT